MFKCLDLKGVPLNVTEFLLYYRTPEEVGVESSLTYSGGPSKKLRLSEPRVFKPMIPPENYAKRGLETKRLILGKWPSFMNAPLSSNSKGGGNSRSVSLCDLFTIMAFF